MAVHSSLARVILITGAVAAEVVDLKLDKGVCTNNGPVADWIQDLVQLGTGSL